MRTVSSRDGSSGWSDLLSEDEPKTPSSGSSAPRSPRGRRRPKPSDSAPAKAAPPPQAGLSLPSPNTKPAARSRPAPGAGLSLPSPVASAKPTVDSDILGSGLQEHLSGSTTASHPGAEPSGAAVWKEYREVILSIAGGILLLGLAIWYTQSRQPEPEVFEGSTKAAVPETPAPPKPQPAKTPTPPPAAKAVGAAAAPTKAKTRTPMLSIVSTPPDALVEIDGVVYGKTPIIMPSPSSSTLQITLKANGHKKWSKNVMPNEAGHFAVNAKLELQ